MTTTTPAHTPPDKPTDEATKQGLQLAHEAGQAYLRMVDYFIQNVATSGQKKRAGDYIIGCAVEEAEPLYYRMGPDLKLGEPPLGDNAHLEIVVADADDGRFIPELTIFATIIDASGKEVATLHLPFLWHPTMYHYGRDFHVPGAGKYTVRVAIDAPTFPRHDKVNGKRYAQPVTAEFTGVDIKPGRK